MEINDSTEFYFEAGYNIYNDLCEWELKYSNNGIPETVE